LKGIFIFFSAHFERSVTGKSVRHFEIWNYLETGNSSKNRQQETSCDEEFEVGLHHPSSIIHHHADGRSRSE
jgi:hypothetical protein